MGHPQNMGRGCTMVTARVVPEESAVESVRYNSRQQMNHILLRLRRYGEIAVCALLFSGIALAAQWSGPAAQLAGNIAEISGPGTAHFSYRNASTLSGAELQGFTQELENALRSKGLRLVTGGAAVDVDVSVSENLRGYVLVAEVHQGRDVRTAVVMAPRAGPPAAQGGGSSVTLRKTLLVEQDEPILDALLLNPAQLVTVGANRISVYTRNGEQWQVHSSYELQHARPWPLDLRGRLIPANASAFDAYLPGVVCSSVTVSPVVMSCRAADDPWPVGDKQAAFFNGARNYFNGVLSPAIGSQNNVDAFYSAVALPRSGYTLWVFAGVDGRVRLADGKDVASVRANSAARDWGSDIAALNGCGRGPFIVATGGGDGTVTDTLRAYDMPDREPMIVSPSLETPGPVTALWSSADMKSVVAVAHTLATGKYDAYSVTITCNQ